jgi:putative tryptophan/tyrosine transport system substrate-binding protein
MSVLSLGGSMRRREFITLFGGAAAWPIATHAQQQIPLVGFLNGQTAGGYAHVVAAFKQGLNETGFVEDQNVTIEYRWADQHFDRLPELAADLVRRQPTVLVATGGAAQMAVFAATKTIPIVASFGGDPVRLGHVASLNHPGGNITGVSVFSADLEAKRLELINEVVPRGEIIGYLFAPNFEYSDVARREVENAAQRIRRNIRVVEVSEDADLEKAFTTLAELKVGGVLMAASALFNNLRDHLLALTTRLKLPAIHESREFVAAGGLMSYGTNVPEVYRQVGIYTGRVLKGEKPADLPVLEPTKFDMSVNLKTAKALGVDMPTSILLRANEIIE